MMRGVPEALDLLALGATVPDGVEHDVVATAAC
jgi:hypothetical protein